MLKIKMRRALFALSHTLADDAAHRGEMDWILYLSAAPGAAAPAGAARSTSSASMLPSGPLPLSDVRSMPFSRAILLAAGEASKRPGLELIETARLV